jgi:hypothetical protein
MNQNKDRYDAIKQALIERGIAEDAIIGQMNVDGTPVICLQRGDMRESVSAQHLALGASDVLTDLDRDYIAWLKRNFGDVNRAIDNPIPSVEAEMSKYQQVIDLLRSRCYVPSAITPHLDVLDAHNLVDSTLTVDQLADIVVSMQEAYRNGQASTGAEKIDTDCVWVSGIGALEQQPDGSWKLTAIDG